MGQVRRMQFPIASVALLPSPLVDAGDFVSYGPDRSANVRHCLCYADEILRGAQAAGFTAAMPCTVETILNLRGANALGISVSMCTLLLRADRVIE